MKNSKQITIGLFSVVVIWVLQTVFLGEIGFIDTIYFGGGSDFLSNYFPIIYMLAFIYTGYIAGRKSYDVLFKTSFITGLIPAIYAFILFSEKIYEDLALTGNSAVFKALGNLCEGLVTLFYPLIVIVYPFGVSDFTQMVFILSPIACALVYLLYPLVKRK
ncbi:MAG: hypothetical protein IJO73_06390 [Clostridia bacterium]|nr:hypothetical protein [Clostridia bacterium]